MFKNIDGQLTTILTATQRINTGLGITSNEIGIIVDKFNEINKDQNTEKLNKFYNDVSAKNANVANMFKEIAKQGSSAKASVQDVYAAILNGNTTGFKNVQSVIKTFNSVDPSHQSEFAKAVGQTNRQLGNYLVNMRSGTASMAGYGAQLVANTTKTIALKTATMALNAVIGLAISSVISFVISKITELSSKQDELIQKANESADKIKEQAKQLEDLKTAYTDIINSEKTAVEKTEELNEWKETLIKTYGFEREALEDINLEREKGLGLLDEEIRRQNRKDADLWLGEHSDEFEEARKAIQEYTIRGETYSSGNTVYERKANVEKEIARLGAKKTLTVAEESKLKRLNKELDEFKKTIEKYGDIYTTGYNFKADQVFDDYINSSGKLEQVGKDTYSEWRNGLISAADGDKELKKILEERAAQQFPDYEKVFQDRSNVETKLKKAGIVGDEAEEFINSLSDLDLDILANKIKNPFADGIDGAKKIIEDFKNDPANKIETKTDTKSLDDLKEQYDGLSESIDNFAKNEKAVKEALDEQEKHGQLSADSIKSLVDAGYASALMYDETTGEVTLNTAELERLNDQKRTEIKLDLIKQKTDLAEKYSEEQKAISDLRLEYEALAKAGAAANQTRLNEIMLALAEHGATASEISGLINQYDGLINSLDAPTFDNDKGDTTDTNKDEFDKLYSEKKHDLEMNRISEEEFINWLDGAYKEYFSDLTKYQDEYNKYEEEVYKSRKDREQELFDLKMDNHKKLADNALEGKIDIDKFNKDMQAEYGLGNVDLTKRPKVKMEDGSTATVLSASEFVWQGDEENGKYVVVHYTPILPDGTILDDNTLNDYLYNTLENSENILDTDKNGLGIVLKVDTDFDISDEDVRSLETDKPTENIQNIIAACDEWDVALHEIQEDWVELTDAVSGDNIAASFDYARNEINAAIADIQARIDELSLIPGSEDEIAKLRDDLDGLYDVLDDIDDKERESEIDYIEKQKDNFTDTIDQHIDDIERESDAVEKAYDKRIKAIDKQADAYDKQADNIDKEIEAIEKTNEAEKRKTDILEAQKKVKEAELELEKAHVKNRLVYVGNGRYEAKEDKDAVKEAEENLANAKAELAEKLQEEQVNILKDQKADIEAQKDILEEQKSVIEEAKDNADEYYSDIKDNLEQQKDTGEKTYDALIDILENADGKTVQNASNSELYNRLAGTDDLKKAVDGLSPSEKQAAFDSGLLSVDSNGNYSLDYTAVDDNSQAVKDNTAATENLDNTLQKFMPDNTEGDKADVTETADNNKSKVKPVTYTEWKKRHTLSEYAPNGKDVPNMTFEEYFRQLTGDKKSGKSNDITKSIEDYFKEITGIDISKYSNTPTASENFGNAMKGIIGDIFTGNNENVVNNVSDTHNDPQFNCTINIEGSADEKTVERMKNEINSALNE